MGVITKNIIPAKQAENTMTSQYQAVNCKCQITKFTAINTSAAIAGIDVHLVASGDGDTDGNRIANLMLQPGETYTFPELVGHVIENGGTIQTEASAGSSITIRASGLEIT